MPRAIETELMPSLENDMGGVHIAPDWHNALCGKQLDPANRVPREEVPLESWCPSCLAIWEGQGG